MDQNTGFERKRLGLFAVALAVVAAVLFVNWAGQGSLVQIALKQAGVAAAPAEVAAAAAAFEQASVVPALAAPSRAALRAGASSGGSPFGEELRASASAERASDRLLVTGQPDVPEADERTAAFQGSAVERQPQVKSAARSGEMAPAPAAAESHSRLAEARAVRYGVTTREELMGRGAGPVYNLKGKESLGEQGYEPDKVREHTRTMVEQIREQTLANPNLTAEQREKMLQGLKQIDEQANEIGRIGQ